MKKILTTFILLCLCTCFVHAQIKVDVDGTVRMGNASTFLYDEGTRLEVDVLTTTIKTSQRVPPFSYPPLSVVGIQFSRNTERHVSSTYGGITAFVDIDVMALTGLDNKKASIGTVDNNMLSLYSQNIFLSGTDLGPLVTSDATLKTNIRELTAVSERIQKLRPVMYDFVKDGSGDDVSKNPAFKNRTGFIAQEVQKLFPDLVTIGSDSLLRLDYAGLIPYLTQTIQEQQRENQEQRAVIEKLQQQVNDIQTGAYFANFDVTTGEQPQRQSASPAENGNVLHQNTPNPFSNTTTIAYQLAEDVANAKICIYNLAGKQLQCHELPATQGENTIEVRASSLQAGMYLYSLIVGNQLVDTKRMVLTE